ncbi:hypothetical protein [Klebsiella pneumoniae]|jgi:hypothetical protein
MTDWTNPCERAAALRDAYYRVLSGQQEVEIEARTGDGGQMVKFGKVDLNRLKSEWQAAEDECQRANGVTPAPRRSVISLGGVRRRYW